LEAPWISYLLHVSIRWSTATLNLHYCRKMSWLREYRTSNSAATPLPQNFLNLKAGSEQDTRKFSDTRRCKVSCQSHCALTKDRTPCVIRSYTRFVFAAGLRHFWAQFRYTSECPNTWPDNAERHWLFQQNKCTADTLDYIPNCWHMLLVSIGLHVSRHCVTSLRRRVAAACGGSRGWLGEDFSYVVMIGLINYCTNRHMHPVHYYIRLLLISYMFRQQAAILSECFCNVAE
jgi:hypothetical protein